MAMEIVMIVMEVMSSQIRFQFMSISIKEFVVIKSYNSLKVQFRKNFKGKKSSKSLQNRSLFYELILN